jgi:hypothetical protein
VTENIEERTRIVVISDLHTGSRSGLTPPDWQYCNETEDPVQAKYGDFQRQTWGWYCNTMAALQPIDRLVVNGDALDGKGEKQGGTDQLTTDRRVQVAMADRVIEEAHAKRVAIIKGTPYHTGRDEDWEEVLAEKVGADRCGAHEWFDAHGWTLDFKHKIASSSVPHGRHTALARARLWNLLWAERQLQPKAHILVRSHAHTYVFDGGAKWLAMITPGLQGLTKYGGLEMEGTIDYGLISIDVTPRGWIWQAYLADLFFAAAKAIPA